jgi:hypothetical protein
MMGELQPMEKAVAIIAVMTNGPNLPTELAEHNPHQSFHGCS